MVRDLHHPENLKAIGWLPSSESCSVFLDQTGLGSEESHSIVPITAFEFGMQKKGSRKRF
jgi:hypothetical protein